MEEADALASFLEPMLRLHPDKRAKAADLIHHRWLDGIVVQGEIDVIRRAEREEEEKRDAAGSHAPEVDFGTPGPGHRADAPAIHLPDSGSTNIDEAALTQSEVDAMKPVGEVNGPQQVVNERSPSKGGHHVPPRLNTPPTSSSAQAKENAGVASPVRSPVGKKKGGSKKRN